VAKADQEALSGLHEGLANHLKAKLDTGDISVGELGILRQFLKDNQITAQPVAGSAFGDLVAAVPDLEKVIAMHPRRQRA
jgi:hypothetical protein